MPSQGSAAQADGPPHGDGSSHPSMADRREIERGRERVWGGCVEVKLGGLYSRATRRDKRERRYFRVRGGAHM